MTFWAEVLAIFIGDIFASVIIIVLYAIVQWFLRATDVTVSYNWGWKGIDYSPNFDIRNRSGSRTYQLANIAYTKDKGKKVVWFDNESLWGKELKPSKSVGCRFDSYRAHHLSLQPQDLRSTLVLRLLQSGHELDNALRRFAISNQPPDGDGFRLLGSQDHCEHVRCWSPADGQELVGIGSDQRLGEHHSQYPIGYIADWRCRTCQFDVFAKTKLRSRAEALLCF